MTKHTSTNGIVARALPVALLLAAASPAAAAGLDWLNRYNVTWASPSADCHGSMPLGDGDISLNAWVEAGGDLCFYIGKTDLWDDNGRLLKLGLVRVKLNPNSFAAGGQFKQELNLQTATLVITATPAGAAGGPTTVRLWADANHPAIHVTVEGPAASDATISFELWRKDRLTLPSIEVSDMLAGAPKDMPGTGPTVVEPDTVLQNEPDGIGWYHRNIKSVGPELVMKLQDLLDAPWKDPFVNRTMGAIIRADGGKRVDDQHLASTGKTRHAFSVYVLTQQPATAEGWLDSLRKQIQEIEAQPFDARLAAHQQWWAQFWNRSRIDIRDAAGATDTPGHDVALAYNLQRFITASAGRGAYPIKFNGSIFTVPAPGGPGDADYRRWGPGYWWQNTRLPYESMCTAGDYDLMKPLFHMYGGEVLAVSKYRTKHYFGFEDAAYFVECIYPWGAVFQDSYGWTPPASERKDKLQALGYHKYEWVGGLELACFMHDYYDHALDESFRERTLLPTALATLRFFDSYYKSGPDGKLLMHPSQALETWWDCTNPMPELAGLIALTDRLLALPADKLPAADRQFVQQLHDKLPALPVREVKGVKMLAPAEKFGQKSNVENPELYAVFPFRLVSFEKDNAKLGIEALNHREDKGAFGWRQDDVFMAYLGLTDEARNFVVERARKKDPGSRFPAFWGPNYDWIPDQDHGGILMKAVQALLIQTEGRKIFLLPAWPKQWDVSFKLHAPYQTTIEGEFRNGKLESLKVEPESRRADVQVIEAARGG